MKLNLGNAKPKQPKPTTSLAEKTNAHKFSLPPAKPVAAKPAGLKLGGAKPVTPTKPVETATVVVKTNAIPQVSDEKFNIVEGAEAFLSAEAGDKFRDMLTMLEENIDSEGDLQRILKGTMEYLQDNPECDAILRPEDRAVFVRAARKSYGITITAKTTRKAATTKNEKKVDELMDELADLDFAI